MRTIFYWPEGTWCDRSELPYMSHMSDDFGTFQTSWHTLDVEIERRVATELGEDWD